MEKAKLEIRSLLARWWSPFFTHSAAYLIFLFALPLLTLDLLNSRTLVILEIAAGAILLPLLLARAHKASLLWAAGCELAAALAIFYQWPSAEQQMGNWKMQIAGHIALGTLVGFCLCALGQAVFLLRKMRQ